jgi:hypothetical protein
MEYFSVITDATTGESTRVDWTQEQIDVYLAEQKVEFASTNKQQAKNLLAQSDWTTIADVTDSTKSNPYLANSADFINYRNQLRAIVFNPPDTEITFPVYPTEQWVTV